MKLNKEDISTLESLQTKLSAIMDSGLPDFIKSTNAQRIAVRASIRFVVVSVLFIGAIAVFLYMAQIDFNTFGGKIIAMFALLWATVLLISGRSWFVGSALLAREVNMALVPILANTFNRTLLYTYNENAAESVQELLEDSSLLMDELHNLKVRNVYTVFTGVDMRVHEIMLEQSGEDGKTMKHYGTFIDVNLSKEESAETLFSTIGNSYGFSHEQFVDYLADEERFQAVDMPTDRKYDLTVHSTGSTEADSSVTPEVLGIIHAWGKAAQANVRVMRKGTKLYILVPGSKESTTYTSTSTKQEAIERYALLISRPIWRGLMLAEEMGENNNQTEQQTPVT